MLQRLTFPDEKPLHIWFSKILGVPDIDTIILCPNVGIFVVELKSWSLSCIKSIGHFGFEIDPSCKSSSASPWEQSKNACDALVSQMKRSSQWKNLRTPWLSSGLSLFRISQETFRSHFPKADRTTVDQITFLSDRLIFADDLEDGMKLIQKLKFIRDNPIIGKSPTFHDEKKYDDKMANELDRYFNWKGSSSESPSAYDYKRLEIIENIEEKRLDRVDLGSPIICTGYAGTGKTVLGLQATLRKKASSLFLCFNKVLASDIRRITSISPRFDQFPFESHDIYELIDICEERLRLQKLKNDGDFEEWTKKRIKAISDKDNELGKVLGKVWEFIVVDEAQDLFDDAWVLINQLVGPKTSLFVVDGKNQLLYRETPSNYLNNTLRPIMPDDNYIQKRRVFRTTDSTFLLSQLFTLSYPQETEAQSIWEKKLGPQYRKALAKQNLDQGLEEEFELPRRGGSPPKPINIWKKSGDLMEVKESAVIHISNMLINAYKKISNYSNGKAGDILILVPFKDRSNSNRNPTPTDSIDWLKIAKTSCEKAGLAFIDYTDDQTRREVYTPNEVRIVTFQSSRGVEGLHTIVLGFEKLAVSAQNDPKKVRNLGYIVLSRSVYDTDILCYEPEDVIIKNVEIKFLKSILEISGL